MPPRYIAVPFLSGGGTVLPIPTPSLTATAVSGSQINLAVTYSGPPGATSYAFESSSNVNGPFVPLASGTSNSFSYTGLPSSSIFFFRARVQVVDGRFSDYTSTVSATTLAAVPDAITGVNATATSQTTVSVTWNAVTSLPLTGYHVYRGGVLVSTQTSLTFNDTGLTAGTSYTYVVAAFNNAGEGPSGTDSALTFQIITPPGTAIKLVPGNGWWFDNQFWYDSNYNNGTEAQAFNAGFNTIASNPLNKYFYLSLTWGHCEGPTRGDYTFAFNAIDAMLAKAATAPHKMGVIVEVWQTFFNTLSTTSLACWPQYVVNNGWVNAGVQASANRTQLKWDIDDIWTAFGNMCTAILDRYNSHPLFYGFSAMDESDAITITDNRTTWMNPVHYQQKFLALQLLMKQHAPNTLIYVPFNYMPPGDSTEPQVIANMIRTLQNADPYGFIYGGPDPFLRGTTFQKVVQGVYQATNNMGDVRHQLLLMNRTQEGFLNKTTPTPSTNYATGLANNCVLMTWNYESWELWKAPDEQAAINANNGAVGTPPPGGNYTLG